MDSKAVKDESQNTSVEEIEAKHDTIEATGQNKIVELRKIPLTFKEQSGRKTSFEMKWKALLGKAFKVSFHFNLNIITLKFDDKFCSGLKDETVWFQAHINSTMMDSDLVLIKHLNQQT